MKTSLLVAALFAVVLTGCGKKEEPPVAAPAPAPAPVAAPAPAPEQKPADQAAAPAGEQKPTDQAAAPAAPAAEPKKEEEKK